MNNMVTICVRPRTVVLNVSGERFEIRVDMFDEYSTTILAKQLQKHCKDGQFNDELFLNRCPKLFRFVLQYVRDKKVHLPIGISKTSLMNELQFYCFDNIDEASIDVDCSLTAKGFGHLVEHGQEVLKDVKTKLEVHQKSLSSLEETLEKRRKCLDIAKNCIHKKMEGISKYRDFRIEMSETECQMVNEYLLDVGIQVKKDYETNVCEIYSIPEVQNQKW